jgi:DNA-binding NarL/FixJ family response regulator
MNHAVIIHRSDIMQLALQALLTDTLNARLLTVGRFFTWEAARPTFQSPFPQLVIFEAQPHGIATARDIHVMAPRTRQVVIGTSTDCDFIGGLFKAGVAAYLHLHDGLLEALPTAVRLVQAGRTYLSPLVSVDYKVLVRNRHVYALDSRSVNVLLMLIAGHSVNEIMEHLNLSQDAVYRVRARLRHWFGVETNEAVIERAIAQGYSTAGGAP